MADFAIERTTDADVEIWIADILKRADRTFDGLMERRSTLKDGDRALIDELLQHRGALRSKLREFMPAGIECFNIRHHGDFHLGQMLIVKDDVYIIDFEGEPRRPIGERRRKAPAARDVAGLIRSIDYSVTAALERALKISPDEQGRIAAALDGWREHATSAFRDAYRETMGHSELWPTEPDRWQGILNFFLLEKAFYEIEYELAHRPDWLRVPVSGTLRILATASAHLMKDPS